MAVTKVGCGESRAAARFGEHAWAGGNATEASPDARATPEQRRAITATEGTGMRVLGINSVFHDPAAALIVDGAVVAAAEEERFSRRKHGKRPVPFAAWERPAAARWCLRQAGLTPADVDLIGFSYDPALVRSAAAMGIDDPWDNLRTLYATHAPQFLAEELPGLDPARGVVRAPPRRPRRLGRRGRVRRGAPCWSATAVASGILSGRPVLAPASSRSWPPSRCRTRSACCTRI